MATSKKTVAKKATAKRSPAKKVPARKGAAAKRPPTAAKKPYRENTPANTTPPKMRPNDAVDLLVNEHMAADKIFKQFDKLAKKSAPGPQRQALALKVCAMLTVHAQIEEEIFYPAARAAGIEDDMLDEAFIEHASAKDLIAQIEAAAPDSEYYDAKVRVLGDYIGHHVLEEHTEMFPKCRRSTMDLAGLGRQMAARRKELETPARTPTSRG
ncbi:MAG: hemerythrin domain-containing protein [Caldimonas sp.]